MLDIRRSSQFSVHAGKPEELFKLGGDLMRNDSGIAL